MLLKRHIQVEESKTNFFLFPAFGSFFSILINGLVCRCSKNVGNVFFFY